MPPINEELALVLRRKIGNRLRQFSNEIVVNGGQFADDDDKVGPPARLARRNDHAALVREQRHLAGKGGAIHMVIGCANALGERDRRARAVNIRIEAEYRAPACGQKLSGMFSRALHQHFPVADPCNRHSLCYFLVPAQL